MATPATVKEGFKWKYKANVSAEIVEVDFAPGEQVQILREWKNGTCLVRKGNQVFNVPKKYLEA
jgi:hypothetical protein